MLQSLLAVLGGFAAMAVIVMLTTAIAAALLIPGGMASMGGPAVPLPPAYFVVNLSCSGLAAFVGGGITARIASVQPLWHGVALAALMVVMSRLSMRQAEGRQPRWYQFVLMTLMPVVAVAGAWAMAIWSEIPR